MKLQEILDKFVSQLTIENYSNRTIKSYSSTLKLFLEWVSSNKFEKVTNDVVNNCLLFCKEKKNYSFLLTAGKLLNENSYWWNTVFSLKSTK